MAARWVGPLHASVIKNYNLRTSVTVTYHGQTRRHDTVVFNIYGKSSKYFKITLWIPEIATPRQSKSFSSLASFGNTDSYVNFKIQTMNICSKQLIALPFSRPDVLKMARMIVHATQRNDIQRYDNDEKAEANDAKAEANRNRSQS